MYTSMNALYQTNLSFTSQNIGAEKYTRIKKILATCQGVVVTVGLVLGFAAYLGGPWLLQIYSEDADVISYGLLRMSIICTTYFLCGVMDTMVGSIRGLGYSILPTLVSGQRLRFHPSDLDLYHICSAAVAGDPVSVVPNLLGGHCDGTY